MNNNISDNDDDLFSDSPKKTFSSSSRIIEDIDLDNLPIKEEFQGSSNLKFSMAFMMACHHYMNSELPSALGKAVEVTLNRLTDNQFSKFLQITRTEQKIVGLSTILSVLKQVINEGKFLDDVTDEQHHLYLTFKSLNVNLNQEYIDVYFRPLFNTLTVSIALNQSYYVGLCADLGLEPIQNLLDHYDDITDETADQISYTHYSNINRKDVYTQILLSESFNNHISQYFGSSYTWNVNKHQDEN